MRSRRQYLPIKLAFRGERVQCGCKGAVPSAPSYLCATDSARLASKCILIICPYFLLISKEISHFKNCSKRFLSFLFFLNLLAYKICYLRSDELFVTLKVHTDCNTRLFIDIITIKSILFRFRSLFENRFNFLFETLVRKVFSS